MNLKSLIKKLIFKPQKVEIGKCNIQGNAKVISCNIDDYTYVSPNSLIKHTNIGKFTSIATNCVIGENDHPYKFLSMSPIFYHKGNIFGETWTDLDHIQIYKKTIIGNDVWIGANVFIKSGLKIGDGAVIAAGAVVTKDVSPYSIVGGVPSKHIKYRFSLEIIEKLLSINWWNWDIEKIKKYKDYFITEDENKILEFLKKVS